MNNYRIILAHKQKMYEDIIGRDKIVADNVVLCFPRVESGWFDVSVVVNDKEEYLFSFSDINEDLYKFIDWLKECARFDNVQSSVYIDCEFEQMAFTLEKLPTEYHRANYSSLGLLWWFNDAAESPEIQYCIVNIAEFVTKTYMALLQTAISKRFKILAWWQDEYMRENEEMSNFEYDGYEILQLETMSELVSNRLQLLFYNKIRSKELDELAFETSHWYPTTTNVEIENVVLLQLTNKEYTLRDLNGKDYNGYSLPVPSGNIILDAIKLRERLPKNISLFCSGLSININNRAPDVKYQIPYAQTIPILIPYSAKKLIINFFD